MIKELAKAYADTKKAYEEADAALRQHLIDGCKFKAGTDAIFIGRYIGDIPTGTKIYLEEVRVDMSVRDNTFSYIIYFKARRYTREGSLSKRQISRNIYTRDICLEGDYTPSTPPTELKTHNIEL